jgi:LysR family nitrogen assimilation transcriptional regulator
VDSRQLRYFAAVYQQGNVSRAADICNVAQSALSHHVANLEAEFGTPLFTRQPRGMEPTAAGERLYQHAKVILKAIATAEKDIRQSGEDVAGDIAVGMAYSATKAIGLAMMKAVIARYPKIRLSLTESLSSSTLVHLMASEVDLALVYNPPADKRLVSEPVLEEAMFCIGTRAVIGGTDEPITFDELLAMPIIQLRQGIASRALLDDPALLRKLDARANLQINSVYAIAEAVMAGLGCSVSTKLVMREHLASGALNARKVVAPELSRTLYLCHLADRPATFVMEVMRKLIIELISREIMAGGWEARPLLRA